MFTATDHDKLLQIMDESPEKKELILRLLESHRMELSMISHEIRNPLTMVYSTLQLIETQHPEVQDFRHWNELHQDVEYMNLLLTDLSAYNNGGRLCPKPVPMTNFLRELALSFASSIMDSPVEFTSRIAEDLPVLSADPVKLRQVFLNLLANARDAVLEQSSTGSRTQNFIRAITLEADRTEEGLKICVTDTGCGIPADALLSIFQPFVTFKQSGTGLGLALASRIIQAHGGWIQADSPSDGPTVFTVFLPVQENSQEKSGSQASHMGGVIHAGTGESKVQA